MALFSLSVNSTTTPVVYGLAANFRLSMPTDDLTDDLIAASDSISESTVSALGPSSNSLLLLVSALEPSSNSSVAAGSVSLLLEAHGLGSLITVLIELQLRVARVAI